MSNIPVYKRKRTKKNLNYQDFHAVVVHLSNKNAQIQLLEPKSKNTLVTFNSNKLTGITKTQKSEKIAEQMSEYLSSKKIDKIIFDRNGRSYQSNRVKTIAEILRKKVTI
jgi:ribosomal protein L18